LEPIEFTEHATRRINGERLTSNLNCLIELTANFGVEQLSTLWFELFDLIESCRLLPTDEYIFEVRVSVDYNAFLRVSFVLSLLET
jgi:hypothetical protein